MADKTPKRPRDLSQWAKRMVEIATGEVDEQEPVKNEAAAELGRKGGKARAKQMSPEQRSEVARKAATTRWKR